VTEPSAELLECATCRTPNPPSRHACWSCGNPLTLGAIIPGSTATARVPPAVGAPLPTGTGAVALSSDAVASGVAKTRSGLLLIVAGFVLVWLPVANLIGIVLILVGFWCVHSARNVFRAAYRRWVVRGANLLLAGVAVGLFGEVTLEVFVARPGNSAVSSVALAGAVFVTAALLLAAVLSLVYDAADPTTRKMLWAGFVAGIVSVLLAELVLPSSPLYVLTAPFQVTGSTNSVFAATLPRVELVPYALFAWAYVRARARVALAALAP
jgi:hypothetical protein